MGWRALRCRDAAALAGVLVAAAPVLTGCAREPAHPTRLVDGSPVRVSTIDFEDARSPVLLAKLGAVRAGRLASGSRASSCLRAGWSEGAAGDVVHRVGVDGESVTFLAASGGAVMACDGAAQSPTSTRAWCGHAYGRLTGGRLHDPRLDLGGCATGSGTPVAFLWVEPERRTRYVVVERRGFSEAYATSSGLPVRVSATENIDVTRSAAIVEVSEHDAVGRRLRAYELEARVAG
jgi:hypothetical protein